MTRVSRRGMLGSLAAVPQIARPAEQRTKHDARPLHYLSLMEIAERIRRRELSPVETTKAQLARIENLDGKLNAYSLVLPERALKAARQAEAEISSGHYRGPLHGVPVAVKDLLFTKGIVTKGGCKALSSVVPEYDATVLERLESAGAVLLGKLNLTEGAMAGYHPDFKVPRNPWDANRTPGISSSGPGVATAAGLSFGTIGTDTGGSIRLPSAANGIVGLKPTRGRVSRYGVLPLAVSLDHVGPMTRRVADAAAMLSAVAGEDTNDPTTISGSAPDYLKDLGKGVKGLRLGFDDAYATEGAPAHVAAAIRQAVVELEKLGANVIPVQMPAMDSNVLGAWFVLTAVEAVVAHERTYPSRAKDYGVYFRALLETGTRTSGGEYARACAIRAEFNGRLRRAFQTFDVLACPSAIAEAPVYDPGKASGGEDSAARTVAGIPLAWLMGSGRFTFPYDYCGYPTLSLPCGFSPDGMPLSLQLVGHPLSESLLCRTGHAYESATTWHQRFPSV